MNNSFSSIDEFDKKEGITDLDYETTKPFSSDRIANGAEEKVEVNNDTSEIGDSTTNKKPIIAEKVKGGYYF